jgi:hypothetical protein
MALVFEKLKRVRSLVAYIDQMPVCGQALRAAQPEQALPRLALPALRECFPRGPIHAAMEDLIRQAEHLPARGLHCQAVGADVPAARPLADLSQLATQRGQRGVIQLGPVVQDQNRFRMFGNRLERMPTYRVENCPVGHLGASTQPVQRSQVLGGLELLGQGSSRMPAELLEDRHEAFGASSISQVRLSKDVLTKARRVFVILLHGGSVLKNSQTRSGDSRNSYARTGHRGFACNCSVKTRSGHMSTLFPEPATSSAATHPA